MNKTCYGCKNLVHYSIGFGSVSASCQGRDKDNPFIVPHRFADGEVTYWRVPENCPLSDDQVHKSSHKAPLEDWVVIKVKDLTDVKDGFDLVKKRLGQPV